MQSAQDRVFEIDGRRLAAKLYGPEDGAPTLALHGWMDNAASFDRLAPLLGDRRTCALDFAGHGRSDHLPAGVHYSWFTYLSDAFAVADALGWQRFTLIGHSMGAHISVYMGAVAPDRVDRTVLIDAIGHPGLNPAKLATETEKALTRFRNFRLRSTPLYETLDAMLGPRMNAVGNITEAAARILLDRGVRPYQNGFTWTSDARLMYPDPTRLTEAQVMAFIQAVKSPSLLLLGEAGWPWTPDFIARHTGAHRHLRTLRLPGGHHLHLEDNTVDAVAEQIRGFLAAQSPEFG